MNRARRKWRLPQFPAGLTNALYPNDHTHTSPAGAKLVAEAFAEAIAKKMNGTTSLASYITTVPNVYRL